MIKAGELIKRISFEQRVSTTDPNTKKAVFTWTPTGIEAWASVEPMSGTEMLKYQQVESSVSHRVKMWYQPGITPDMRINYAGRYLNIASVIDPQERHRELEILADEEV